MYSMNDCHENSVDKNNILLEKAILSELDKFVKSGKAKNGKSKYGQHKDKNGHVVKILPEIFYEILHFLSRTELEKCQLISKNWHTFISAQSHLLQQQIVEELDLLKFEKVLKIDDHEGKGDEDVGISQKNLDEEKNMVKWRFAVVNNFHVYEFDEEKYKILKEIQEQTRDFIRVRKMTINLANRGFHFGTNFETTLYWLSLTSNKIIRTLEVDITLCQNGIQKIVENPRFLKFSGTLSIKLINGRNVRLYEAPSLMEFFNYKEFECMDRKFIDFGKISNENFVEEYVKLFQKLPATDLWKLFRTMEASPTALAIQNGINFMEQPIMKPYILRIKSKSILSGLFGNKFVKSPENFVEKNYRVSRKYDKWFLVVVLKNFGIEGCKTIFELCHEEE